MRCVLAPDAAMRMIAGRALPAEGVALLAPTLLRSQLLSRLYAMAREGDIDRAEAAARLQHLRRLRPRLLGDRVLMDQAWRIAEKLGWDDTGMAEYVALTRLQADALVTSDAALRAEVAGLVTVVAPEDVIAP